MGTILDMPDTTGAQYYEIYRYSPTVFAGTGAKSRNATVAAGSTYLNTRFAVAKDGVINRWCVYCGTAFSGTVKFKVFRPNGSSYDFVQEATIPTAFVAGFNVKSTADIAVLKGDLIAVFFSVGTLHVQTASPVPTFNGMVSTPTDRVTSLAIASWVTPGTNTVMSFFAFANGGFARLFNGATKAETAFTFTGSNVFVDVESGNALNPFDGSTITSWPSTAVASGTYNMYLDLGAVQRMRKMILNATIGFSSGNNHVEIYWSDDNASTFGAVANWRLFTIFGTDVINPATGSVYASATNTTLNIPRTARWLRFVIKKTGINVRISELSVFAFSEVVTNGNFTFINDLTTSSFWVNDYDITRKITSHLALSNAITIQVPVGALATDQYAAGDTVMLRQGTQRESAVVSQVRQLFGGTTWQITFTANVVGSFDASTSDFFIDHLPALYRVTGIDATGGSSLPSNIVDNLANYEALA